MFGAAVGVLGVLGTFYAVEGGPPWPADPEISPQDALNGSPLIVPFTVHNPSVLFDISDARFVCGVDWIVFGDANNNASAFFSDLGFVVGTYNIKARQTVNVPCDASALIRISQKQIALGQDDTPPNGSPPVSIPNILKMCVWISADYEIWHRLPHHFVSTIFQRPATPGVWQWLKGSFQDPRAPSKKDALEHGPIYAAGANCSDTPQPPSMILKDGKLVGGEMMKDQKDSGSTEK